MKKSIQRLILFILFYLYIWLRINPLLHFMWQEPYFYLNVSFLKKYLEYPGGPIEYASSFFTQFFCYPWLAALILTICAYFITILTAKFIKTISAKSDLQILQYIPAILLVAVYSNYSHSLASDFGLILSLLGINLYLNKRNSTLILKLVIYSVFSIWLYFIAGGMFLLFTTVCGLYELINKGKVIPGIFYLVIGAVIPYLARIYLFIITFSDSYFNILPFHQIYKLSTYQVYKPGFTPYLLIFFFPLMLIIGTIAENLPAKISKFFDNLKNKYFNKIPLNLVYQTVIIIGAAFVLSQSSFQTGINKALLLDYYAQQEKWDDILEYIQKDKSGNEFTSYMTNRALYHKGLLPWKMFEYYQKWGEDGLIFQQQSLLPNQFSDLYFEMGDLNNAQRWAHEAQARKGETPRVIEKIALINLLKGEKKATRNNLKMLEQTLLYKAKARKYLKYLDDETLLSRDKKLSYINSIKPKSDFISSPTSKKMKLDAILMNNPKNKMAFEYLMATYMLTGDLNKFMQLLPMMKNFNYKQIPKHYEEAILIFLMRTKQDSINLGDYKISDFTKKRFSQCIEFMNRYKTNRLGAEYQFKRSFGDTYWSYFWFDNPFLKKTRNR